MHEKCRNTVGAAAKIAENFTLVPDGKYNP